MHVCLYLMSDSRKVNINEGRERRDDMQQRFPGRFKLGTLGLYGHIIGLVGHQNILILLKDDIESCFPCAILFSSRGMCLHLNKAMVNRKHFLI